MTAPLDRPPGIYSDDDWREWVDSALEWSEEDQTEWEVCDGLR